MTMSAIDIYLEFCQDSFLLLARLFLFYIADELWHKFHLTLLDQFQQLYGYIILKQICRLY